MKMHENCGSCRCQVPLPPLVCSKCLEEGDYLIEVRVTTQPGEEGYSEVVMHLCEFCDRHILNGLIALGFVNHDHGGTAFLQDETCEGGFTACTDPVGNEHGPYHIGNPEYSKAEMGIQRGFIDYHPALPKYGGQYL